MRAQDNLERIKTATRGTIKWGCFFWAIGLGLNIAAAVSPAEAGVSSLVFSGNITLAIIFGSLLAAGGALWIKDTFAPNTSQPRPFVFEDDEEALSDIPDMVEIEVQIIKKAPEPAMQQIPESPSPRYESPEELDRPRYQGSPLSLALASPPSSPGAQLIGKDPEEKKEEPKEERRRRPKSILSGRHSPQMQVYTRKIRYFRQKAQERIPASVKEESPSNLSPGISPQTATVIARGANSFRELNARLQTPPEQGPR